MENDGCLPLQLTEVVHSSSNSSQITNHAIRLVTSHCPTNGSGSGSSSSIETVWDVARNRILVFSGPDSTCRSLHVSLQLPSTAAPPPNATTSATTCTPANSLCWTTFGTSSSTSTNSSPPLPHPVLCCLVNANSLTMWDVHPAHNAGNGNNNNKTTTTTHHVLLPTEGWTVTLPFDCRSICATSTGLLLQRMADADDPAVVAASATATPTGTNHLDNESSFVLQGPPAWKHRIQNLQSSSSNSATQMVAASSSSSPRPGGMLPYSPYVLPQTTTPTTTAAATPSASSSAASPLASLFSLHHPLEDVLPVGVLFGGSGGSSSNNAPPQQRRQSAPSTVWFNKDDHHATTTQQQQLPIVTDVLEHVIYVGTVEWPNDKSNTTTTNRNSNRNTTRNRHSAQVLVTFHATKRCHLIYKLHDAPPAPAALKLHQRTRQQYSVASTIDMDLLSLQQESGGHGGGGDHGGGSGGGIGYGGAGYGGGAGAGNRRASIGAASSTAPRLSWTREDALADALGVTSAKKSQRKDPQQHAAAAAPSLFTPSNAASVLDVSHNTTSAAVHNATTTTAAASTTTTHVLHPQLALTCLYAEPNGASLEPARHVFVAANSVSAADATSTGSTLVLALACRGACKLFALQQQQQPSVTRSNTNNKGASMATTNDLTVAPLEPIPCRAAVPVYAFPAATPDCWRRRRQASQRYVTDICVLTMHGTLSLFRANVPVLALQMKEQTNNRRKGLVVVDLKDAVHDRFSVELEDPRTGERFTSRCALTLSLGTKSCTAEGILSVIDAAAACGVGSSDRLHGSLQIRADACRLVQQQELQEQASHGSSHDVAFAAVRAVVLASAKRELFGDAAVPKSDDNETQEPLGKNAWQGLLDSEYHAMYALESVNFLAPPTKEKFTTATPKSETKVVNGSNRMETALASIGALSAKFAGGGKQPNPVLFCHIFDAIHLLYEDSKLLANSAGGETTTLLVGLLVEFCLLFQAAVSQQQTETVQLFLEYYRRDMNDSSFEAICQSSESERKLKSSFVGAAKSKLSSFSPPPCIYSWIDWVMKGGNASRAYGGVYDRLDHESVNAACQTTRSILRIFTLLFNRTPNATRDVDITMILLEEGFTDPVFIRDSLVPAVSLPILEVLHRCRNNPALVELPEWSEAACILVGRRDLGLNMLQRTQVPDLGFEKRRDGSLKEADDAGFTSGSNSELSDDKDGLAHLERSSAMLFPEDNRVHEAARLVRSSRTIFLRVDRAVEVSDHDFERLKQKRLLLLSYRALALPVGRGMLTIGTLDPIPAEPLPLPDLCLKGRVPPTNATLKLDITECPPDMQVWPEFHNGVAAGLRLPLDGEFLRSQLGFTITRTWIVYNRPPVTRPPPTQEDEAAAPQPQSYSHGGLLLALGLRGHLIALEMSDIYEYLTQGTVTTTVGVLLGLAANKRGSCDISVSKMIFLHIPSLIPQHFSAIDVASTVQTAAVTSAGLLFQASSHRMMTEFLLNEIGKRPDTDVNTSDREAYTLACGLALGTVNLCLGDKSGEDRTAGLADLRIEERLLRYVVGGVDHDEEERIRESNDRFSLPNSANGNDSERCSTIYESNLINTGITSPGATLALGLMYMKSGNQSMASALALPDTHFLLEFVRPDFLALRIISRSLILWNEVEPTKEWIENQVPLVVRNAFEHMRTSAKDAYGMRSPVAKAQQDTDYDGRAVRQMYVHVVAGACFGIGLRFAGTGNEKAKAALLNRVTELYAMREASDPVAAALRPELPILETCLGSAAISLAMVMAGTGDLDVLKLFKMLRWRCDDDSKYGSHLIFGMAIGLLFLGGGTCTLGRNPEDIAALVTAFFPRFPTTTSDNQFHLQALRHLYALAVKRKELRAIDVDTGESVYVPIQVRVDDMSEPQLFQAPCLLPNSDSPLKELRVLSDKYYPLTLDLTRRKSSYVFYVKKRNAQLLRPHGMAFLRHSGGKNDFLQQSDAQAMESLTDNQFLTAFADLICESPADEEFSSRALLECLTQDTEEALSVYLALQNGIQSLKDDTGLSAVNFLGNMRLIRTYYQERRSIVGGGSSPLLNTQMLLPFLQELTDRIVSSESLEDDEALRYAHLFYS